MAVLVRGDGKIEPSEFLHRVVTPNSNIAASAAGSTGTATILDDDAGGSLPVIPLAAEKRTERAA